MQAPKPPPAQEVVVEETPLALETPSETTEDTLEDLLAGLLGEPDANGKYPSAPLWTSIEDTRAYAKFLRLFERNPELRERWLAEWDKAQRETLDETLDVLHNDPGVVLEKDPATGETVVVRTPSYRNPLFDIVRLKDRPGFIDHLACTAGDPRVQKLMAIAENGSPSEKAELTDSLGRFCQNYAERKEGDIYDPVPVLAAQLDPDGRTLPTLVAAAERKIEEYEELVRCTQQRQRAAGRQERPASSFPPQDCRGVAYACNTLLDRYLREKALRTRLNPAQMGVLREYARFAQENDILGEGDPRFATVMPVIDYARRLNELATPVQQPESVPDKALAPADSPAESPPESAESGAGDTPRATVDETPPTTAVGATQTIGFGHSKMCCPTTRASRRPIPSTRTIAPRFRASPTLHWTISPCTSRNDPARQSLVAPSRRATRIILCAITEGPGG